MCRRNLLFLVLALNLSCFTTSASHNNKLIDLTQYCIRDDFEKRVEEFFKDESVANPFEAVDLRLDKKLPMRRFLLSEIEYYLPRLEDFDGEQHELSVTTLKNVKKLLNCNALHRSNIQYTHDRTYIQIMK